MGSLALTAFNCSVFAALSFMRFSAFSTACFSLACFGVMSISVTVEALFQLRLLCVFLRSVYLVVDAEASFDPGV